LSGNIFFLPIASSSQSFGTIYDNKVLDLQDNTGLLILAVLGGLMAFGSIFLYNNRKLQISVSSITTITAVALLGLAYWLFDSNTPIDNTISSSFATGFFMPIGSLILSILAIFFIKKDDKLVKSMDRLR